MRDILVVGRKELKELFGIRESLRGWTWRMLGVFLPLQAPEIYVGTPVLAVFLPVVLIGNVVADSFAGERERNTLETLLATRLPDHALFLGKVTAVVVYAWTMTVLILAVGLAVVNVARGPHLPSPVDLVGRLAGALLVAGLMAALGAFISLRARSVRDAQQTFTLLFFLPAVLLAFVLPAVLSEGLRDTLTRFLSTADSVTVGAGLLAVLAVTDAALLAFAVRRFRRAKLTLG